MIEGTEAMTEHVNDYRSIWTGLRDTAFEQGFVTVNGLNTRYVRSGTRGKPFLVMLHGTAGHWEAFSSNFKAHSADFDILALDMIGCGFTDKPNHPLEIKDYMGHVLGFLNVMEVGKAHFMGCSLGAWISAAIARTYPERIGKLVLLSASGYFSSAENRGRIISQRTKAVDDPSWENIKAIFNKLLAKEESRIDDLVAHRQALYRMPEMKQGMLNILALQDPDIRERNLLKDDDWRAITAEALVVGSLADADEYLRTAQVVSKLMPNARYVEMEGVGHWPQFEDPHTFNRLSLEFLTA
ncbi:MAG TPA: alpha/beta hydrolase [Rhizobiaceae bacterium]|nr:alpha/beta hydrolase [Rhizobiaceae bacterium]